MSMGANRERSVDDVPEDAFQNFIEERYAEWEIEFGDGVDTRRTVSFDPKK